MLLKYLPEVKNFQGEIKTAPSPGMKYKHYAPIVDCVLSRTALSALKEYKRARAEGKKAVIMGRKGYISDKSVDFIDLGANFGADSQESLPKDAGSRKNIQPYNHRRIFPQRFGVLHNE